MIGELQPSPRPRPRRRPSCAGGGGGGWGAGTPEPQPRPATWFGGCTSSVYSEPGPLAHLSRPLTCHLPRGGGISLRYRSRNSVCSEQGTTPPPPRAGSGRWAGAGGLGSPTVPLVPPQPHSVLGRRAPRAPTGREALVGSAPPPSDLTGAKAQGGLSLPRAPAPPAPQVSSLTLPPCFQRDLLCPLYFSTSNIRSIKK